MGFYEGFWHEDRSRETVVSKVSVLRSLVEWGVIIIGLEGEEVS